MGSSQAKGFSRISVFTFLLILCNILLFDVSTASAQQAINVGLANLHANAKLHAPDDILADFDNGEPETAVIVLLRPSADAMSLAISSQATAQVPTEFTAPGAPTFYDLRDESIRKQLKSTVTETVSRVVDGFDATGMTVTQRFSYQFGFSAMVTPEALERIVNSPDVIAVEKDSILQAHLAQGIPLMNASTVRGTYTGAGLSIAICDTGIDTSHPKLGGGGFPNAKVIGGYDTGDNDADPRPGSTGHAHGTACAGIAAGNTGTVGDYIGGVAPDAKLYAVKISTGTTGSASNSAMIAGWEWSITHKNDDPANPILIISTSFGGGQFTATCDSESPAMTTAAANAVAAGITIFASSGNDGFCNSMGWPACISYVNSVGAVYDANFGQNPPIGYVGCIDPASCVGYTSGCPCSTGKCYVDSTTAADMVTTYSNSASFLTLFAPSNQAYTTDIVGSGGDSSGDYSTTFGGTSAACPYAAGSAAVLQSAAKAKTGSFLTPAQVKTYLINNGDNVTDSKVAITKPRINLGRATDALTSVPAPILSAEPSVTPGTENTIYWSAVSSMAASPLMVEPRPVGQVASTSLSGSSAVASQSFFEASTSNKGIITTETVPTVSSLNNSQHAVTATPALQTLTDASSGALDKGLNAYQLPLQPASETLVNNEHLIENAKFTPAQATLPLESVFIPQDEGWKVLSSAEPLAATSIFGETFEGSFPGTSWTLYGSPTWNDTSYDKYGGSWSGWCGGSSLSPPNGYADNMNAWMVYGPFSLADATSASMSFWYKNLSESGFDYFKWFASVDGVNFSGYQISGDQNSWRSQVFDLTSVPTLGDLRGQPQVWIAFNFTSDSSYSGPTFKGAYVDDVIVNKDTANQPNLTSYQPSGWSDKIVVSKVAGTSTDSSPLYPTDTLYIDWAVINNGPAATAARFYTELYVDGVLKMTGYSDPPLSAGNYAYIQDYSIGSLTAGTHTIWIKTDSTGVIAESNESDNEYTKTITVTAVSNPNLTPYNPSGWSDKIVVSKVAGTSTDSSPLYPTDTLYIDWAVINNGSAVTAARFYTELYVDGVLKMSGYSDPPLSAGNYAYIQDYSIGSLTAGTHTIRIKTDSTGVIAESNESDNEYTKTITVTAPVLTEYFAERADNFSFNSPINSGWTTQTQWTFQNLTPGQTYWYRIKAKSGTTESGWSNIEHSQQACTDTTPNAFTFTDQTNVGLNTVATSNTITVSGICAPAAISISGGTYSINGGAYTSLAGTVSNGNTVTVRQTSSASNSTTTNATLTIGGVSDTFGVTTAAPTYTISFSLTGGGAMTCTPTTVPWGGSFTCTVSPGSGYHLEKLLDNSVDVTAQVSGTSYFVANVTAAHNVQATFQQNTTVLRISGGNNETWYTVIQSAYNAASNGDEILTLDSDFYENLNFNRNVSITIQGGCNADFNFVTGFSTIHGTLTISNGTVIIENLILK